MSDNEILELLQDLLQTSNKNVLFNIKNKENLNSKIIDRSMNTDIEELKNMYNKKESLNYEDEVDVNDIGISKNKKDGDIEEYKDLTNELMQQRKPENIINKSMTIENNNGILLNIKNKLKDFDLRTMIRDNIKFKEEYINVIIRVLIGIGLLWIFRALVSYIFNNDIEDVIEGIH